MKRDTDETPYPRRDEEKDPNIIEDLPPVKEDGDEYDDREPPIVERNDEEVVYV